ncbi:PEPxxWA-CTERM sorting domain-containing protein [Sphingomonas echinoides]|uniref:PEPxxWA-CTERM sorting domain-containing protein n=1 Tax=Sphingomonas echinoides TaxID=59803 RepID=UPI0024136BF3|nr:PEPxxWA-CTERM sorting domain-containing protein [Sphingomonas echinoides]
MRTKFLVAAAATAIAIVSTNAYAAANLTSVAITGVGSQGNWATSNDTFTLFMQHPYLTGLNAADGSINFATLNGTNDFLLTGEGTTVNPGFNAYAIVFTFGDGATISGAYNTLFGFSAGSSATVGNTTYTVTDFAWNRGGGDLVGANTIGKSGVTDFAGLAQFDVVESAVPEPTTWLMMLAGFGMVGAGLRSRGKVRTSVTYA